MDELGGRGVLGLVAFPSLRSSESVKRTCLQWGMLLWLCSLCLAGKGGAGFGIWGYTSFAIALGTEPDEPKKIISIARLKVFISQCEHGNRDPLI